MCRVGSNGVRKVSSAVYGSGCVLAVVVAVCPAGSPQNILRLRQYAYDSGSGESDSVFCLLRCWSVL